MRISSERYHDQLNTPLETAIYWVEHVAKYKGSPHLKSVAVDLPYYVYHDLVVRVFVVLVAVITVLLLRLLLQRIRHILRRGDKTKTKTT